MKEHDYLFYIDSERWEEFLKSYEKFGFKREGGFAYPDYVYRETDDGKHLKVHIDKPCVNMWDGEDKNSQREIWLMDGKNRNAKFGSGNKAKVLPYIRDLVDAGYVKSVAET